MGERTDEKPSSDALLSKMASDVQRSFREDRAILSFNEYFDLVVGRPEQFLRSSAQYLVNMLDFFGREERDLAIGKFTRFKLFDAEFTNTEVRVAGQEEVVEDIYRILDNFAREGLVNQLILLHGPNGSAKSSIVRCMMAGLEHYARQPDGAMYRFNWIFPSEKMSRDSIGFGAENRASIARDSYAYLPPDNIDARVPCEMHDHPLFLIPKTQRETLLGELVPDDEKGGVGLRPEGRAGFAVSEYLRAGDLCYKCRCIYDALLASYEGDASKVLNHVQVERLYLSRRYRRGIATVEPQMSVDARVQQVTADNTLQALPKALMHVSLFQPAGPLVDANRGLLEFSDMLKRPVEAFKYLLGTVETSRVTMDSFVLHLDVCNIASTNETYLDAFKQHPDFASFKGRMELVKVPLLARYGDEKQIYEPQIIDKVVGRHVAPHAIDVATLWAVLTRMRRCDSSLYHKEIAEVVASLSPSEKLRMYDTGEVPEHLTTREAKELRHIIPELYRESINYPNYEGGFGASAREIRTVLLNSAHSTVHECLSPLAVFEEIRELLDNKSVYAFLNQEILQGYHDHKDFLRQTEDLFTEWIDDEIRGSMGLVEEGRYLTLFSRYVTHITHWVKKEKLVDPTTGQTIDPDERLMGEIEKVLMSEGESADDFRKSVIGTIGARALDNPDQMPDFGIIFSSYIEMLKEDFYLKRREELRRINENFLKYTSDDVDSIEPEAREQVEGMLAVLEKKYGYCVHCARDTVAYLLRKRYAD